MTSSTAMIGLIATTPPPMVTSGVIENVVNKLADAGLSGLIILLVAVLAYFLGRPLVNAINKIPEKMGELNDTNTRLIHEIRTDRAAQHQEHKELVEQVKKQMERNARD